MTIEEFEDLVDRHGEDLSAWPIDERAAATAILAESAEAREILREAQLLRLGLPSTPIKAPAGLADRIYAHAKLDSSPRLKSSKPRPGLFGWFAAAASGVRPEFVLVACFIIGFAASLLPSEPKALASSTFDLPTLFSRSLR